MNKQRIGNEQHIRALWAFGIVLGLTAAQLLCLLWLGVYPLLSTPQDPVMDRVLSHVQVGDSRESAVEQLSDAWFHAACPHPHSKKIDDLFFYGPRSFDQVEIVLIASEQVGSETTVTFVGGAESYMLHLYEDCTPDPLAVLDGSEPTPVTDR